MAEGKIVYIASPYAGDVEGNVAFARAACRLAMEQGNTPVAAHLLYPQMLDDTVPKQRELGIRMGLRLLGACSELWLCGSRISGGMQEELKEAWKHGIPVRRIPREAVEEFLPPEQGMAGMAQAMGCMGAGL